MDEDEPMADAAQEEEEEATKDNEDEEEEEEEEEDAVHASEAEDDDENKSGADEEAEDEQPAEEEAVKSPSPPPVQTIRRKRLGRPPKNRPPDWDNMIEVPVREGDLNTPRRRGRGGWRGRGGRKGASLAPTQQAIDKEGTLVDIINDEVALPEDPDGETKVDKDGNLLGGREYRCRTFTVAGRGDRLYMLSTEPARCVGFRDSYLFFTKHLRLTKVIVDDEEKRDMIEREIIPHSYKGRSIGIVTARSVFREFGALIVVGGRRITDDYEVAKVRADGIAEGDLADPNDNFVVGEPYNKNQYVAWHGASSVYHSAVPVVPQQTGVFVAPKKRRVAVNDTNWMFEHAKEASNFNSILTGMRHANLYGVYDIHTNMMHYPATMQPTHARIETVPPDQQDQDERADALGHSDSTLLPTIFKPLPPTVPRNFRVVDTVLETPPSGIAPASYDHRFFVDSNRGASGGGARSRGSTDILAPFRGLSAVPDDIRALLPDDCRAAFDEAQRQEREWHAKWGREADAACRRNPVIDKAIVPMVKMI